MLLSQFKKQSSNDDRKIAVVGAVGAGGVAGIVGGRKAGNIVERKYTQFLNNRFHRNRDKIAKKVTELYNNKAIDPTEVFDYSRNASLNNLTRLSTGLEKTPKVKMKGKIIGGALAALGAGTLAYGGIRTLQKRKQRSDKGRKRK